MSKDRFAEILNYLSAMSRDIGQFRSETNARLDALETRMGNLETRMGNLETRMSGLETEVRLVREDMRLMWHRNEIVTGELMEVRTRQRSHSARLEAIEAK